MFRFTQKPIVWGIAGLVLGLGDYLLLKFFGVTMFIGDVDVTFWVVSLFACNFGVLGFVIGHLLEHRRELKHQTEVIQEQYDELQATQKQLIENKKLAAVGRLSAGVAHEVRNPLGVIRTSAKMLTDDLNDPESRQAAEFICEEVDRLNDFVGRLLDFSRPLEPELEGLNLHRLTEGVIARVEDNCNEREIELFNRVPADLDMRADRDLVSQVLTCLVTNAAEAIGQDGTIAFSASEEDDSVTIEVADDGPGLLDEAVEGDDNGPRVFEPFFTTKSSGTGLGLAMADKIAQVHGGSLESVPGGGLGDDGRGACFRLTLPLDTDTSGPMPQATSREAA